MYIDTEKMADEDYFPDIKKFVKNYKKMSTPGAVPKHWLWFSYIRSEDYELDLNLYVTEMKRKTDQSSEDRVKLFHKNIVVI